MSAARTLMVGLLASALAGCASGRDGSETVDHLPISTPRGDAGARGDDAPSAEAPAAPVPSSTVAADLGGTSGSSDEAEPDLSSLGGGDREPGDDFDSGSSVRALSPPPKTAVKLDRLRGAACVLEGDVAKMRALLLESKGRTREASATLERLIREGNRLLKRIHEELERRGVRLDPEGSGACAGASAEASQAARSVLGRPSVATSAEYSRGLSAIERDWLARDRLPKER